MTRTTRTNLCTNPRAGELALTGWVATSTPPAFNANRIFPGWAAAPNPQTVPVGDTAFGIAADSNADGARYDLAVTNGQVVMFSTYVYCFNLASGDRIRLVSRNAANTVIEAGTQGGGGSIDTTQLDGWHRIYLLTTVTATETWRFNVEHVGTAGGSNFFFTGVLLELSSTLGSYFDGGTPGGHWTGAHHASTSTDQLLMRVG